MRSVRCDLSKRKKKVRFVLYSMRPGVAQPRSPASPCCAALGCRPRAELAPLLRLLRSC